MSETVQEALQKIPIAVKNLKLPEQSLGLVSNYIHNLVLTCLKDTELQRRLHEEPEKLLEELSKL